MRPAVAAPDEASLWCTLAGWDDDDHLAGLQCFTRSLSAFHQAIGSRFVHDALKQWPAFVSAAHAATSEAAAQAFFETWFQPVELTPSATQRSLFTGYYEPELAGSRSSSAAFPVPVHARPDDLVNFTPEQQQALGVPCGKHVAGRAQPYDERVEIENGSLEGRAPIICWLASWSDAFFLHIQGSGRVRLQDGSLLRLGFAAKSGRPYRSIGALAVSQGLIPRDSMSMQSLKAWIDAAGPKGRELMWQNPSYIFFRELNLPDAERGAIGAAGVQLTPRRSLAMDDSIWPMGLPVWLETSVPATAIAETEPFRRLMVMQDKGSAIKGKARGDIYFGWGADAEWQAGHMQHAGRLYALVPRFLGKSLDFLP